MDVVVSDEAKEFVNARGAAVYVRSHPHRCSRVSITMLDTTTEPRRIRRLRPGRVPGHHRAASR